MEFPCIDKVDKHLPRLLLLFIFVLFCKRLAVARTIGTCVLPMYNTQFQGGLLYVH